MRYIGNDNYTFDLVQRELSLSTEEINSILLSVQQSKDYIFIDRLSLDINENAGYNRGFLEGREYGWEQSQDYWTDKALNEN